MPILEEVKILLGITDSLQDKLLEVILRLTEEHYKAYTGQISVDNDLWFVVIEVTVKRYNRLGAEGMSSQSMEGISMSFSLDDFKEYDRVFARYYPDEFSAGFKMI